MDGGRGVLESERETKTQRERERENKLNSCVC